MGNGCGGGTRASRGSARWRRWWAAVAAAAVAAAVVSVNEFMAVQKGNTLTITRMQGDATVTTVYNLDGSESKNMVAGRGGGEPTAQVSKAVWDGAKLVVTTTAPNGEQKRVFAIEGGNLTIETTQPGRDGGPGTPTKLTYKKG